MLKALNPKNSSIMCDTLSLTAQACTLLSIYYLMVMWCTYRLNWGLTFFIIILETEMTQECDQKRHQVPEKKKKKAM